MPDNKERQADPGLASQTILESNAPVESVSVNDWQHWRGFTQARIALGRAGAALPTTEVLNFGLAHAQARDAIHTPLDTDALQKALQQDGWQVLHTQSQVAHRTDYLRRPDLGRVLANHVVSQWQADGVNLMPTYDIAIVIGDGLSSLAVQRHAVPLLAHLKVLLNPGLTLAPIVVATQARVALGDAIGQHLNAKLVVMLIGERPGLSSPDSLGIYITYAPQMGKQDAERNCISNVRPEGLNYVLAAFKLNWMIDQAFKRQLTGVQLKDESDEILITNEQSALIP